MYLHTSAEGRHKNQLYQVQRLSVICHKSMNDSTTGIAVVPAKHRAR